MAVAKRRKSAKNAVAESKYEAISATVPTSIVSAVRARTTKRDFSRFVATALARELTRQARTDFLEHVEIDRPIDDVELQDAIARLTS